MNLPRRNTQAQRQHSRVLLFSLMFAGSAAGHEVIPPKPLVQPAPQWPGGKPYSHDVVVPVALLVAADGSVSDVRIEASVGESFDAIATDVARRWRFQPALSQGKPVAARIRAIVRFVGDASRTDRQAKRARSTEESAPESTVDTAEPRFAATRSNVTNAEENAARPGAVQNGAQVVDSVSSTKDARGVERGSSSKGGCVVERGPSSKGGCVVERGPSSKGGSVETFPNSALVVAATDRAEVRPTDSAVDDVSRRSGTLSVEVVGQRVVPPRSASETTRAQDVIQAAPHRTGGDLLQVVPGVFITQHSGQGKAYQVFYRGFDAVHGQDLEFWVGGAPVNEVSNIHGQGYADLHFVMPEVVSTVAVQPGNYHPEQGDFAVAGSIRYELGYREPGITAKGSMGSFGERRAFLAYHRKGSDPGSFAAFEAQSSDGFGPARAATRTSGIAQQVFELGSSDRLRVLASGYAGRFDSPGVVRRADIDAGVLDRFGTYGTSQGGFSSRYQ